MSKLLVALLAASAGALRLAAPLRIAQPKRSIAAPALPKLGRVGTAAAVASLALLAPAPASASHLGDAVAAKLRASGLARRSVRDKRGALHDTRRE